MQRLSPQEICLNIEKAMAPLDCHAESCDHGNKYDFNIRLDGKPDLKFGGWNRSEVQRPESLEGRLMCIRRELIESGHILHDWQGVPRNSAS